jgi:hypothetical protein
MEIVEELKKKIFKRTTNFKVFKSATASKKEKFDASNPNNPNAFNQNRPANDDWGMSGKYRVTQNWMGHNYLRLTMIL